jgi:hypothetical protein
LSKELEETRNAAATAAGRVAELEVTKIFLFFILIIAFCIKSNE